MKIPAPTEIQVGAVHYTIQLVDDLHRFDALRGEVCHNRLIIRLEKRMIPIEKTATLWHEIIHAVDQIWLSHSMADSQVDALANGLHQVLEGMGIEIDWEE